MRKFYSIESNKMISSEIFKKNDVIKPVSILPTVNDAGSPYPEVIIMIILSYIITNA